MSKNKFLNLFIGIFFIFSGTVSFLVMFVWIETNMVKQHYLDSGSGILIQIRTHSYPSLRHNHLLSQLGSCSFVGKNIILIMLQVTELSLDNVRSVGEFEGLTSHFVNLEKLRYQHSRTQQEPIKSLCQLGEAQVSTQQDIL